MKLFALTSIAPLAAALCQHGTTLSPFTDDGLAKRDDGSFGYLGLQGPLNWHALDPLNRICAEGTNQSPINVDAEQETVQGSTFDLRIDQYRDGAVLENLGTTIMVHVNGSALFKGERYDLRQYHFHTPSEHALNGQHYPAEVHFVFQAPDESLAVIAWFLEIAQFGDRTSRPMRQSLRPVHDIPNPGNRSRTDPLDFSELVGDLGRQDVAQYNGSLTTPPCSENVIFNVVKDPLFIGTGPYRTLKGIVGSNARFTQNKPGEVNLLLNAANELHKNE